LQFHKLKFSSQELFTFGQYDFCVIAQADSFAKITALTLGARASGTVDNLISLESVNVEKIRGVSERILEYATKWLIIINALACRS